MKAISLWQPWASAIPLGLKKIETRGWSTPYRGPLVIHAAKRFTKDQKKFSILCSQMDDVDWWPLPFGQVVAVCELTHVMPTEQIEPFITPTEHRYGIYGVGRFAWLLHNIRPLRPFDWRGGQSFFDIPDEVVHAAL